MRHSGWFLTSFVALGLACQPAPKHAAAPSTPSAEPPKPPAPTLAAEAPRENLRTGSIAPILHETSRRLEVVGRAVDGAFEIIELELPPFDSVVDSTEASFTAEYGFLTASVRLEPDANGFAFIGEAQDFARVSAEFVRKQKNERKPLSHGELRRAPLRLWVRRLISAEPPRGALFVPSIRGAKGHRQPFHVERMPAASPRNDKAAELRVRDWASAAAHFFDGHSGAFYAFATARLRSRYLGKAATNSASPRSLQPNELARLMDTTSGRRSLQEALEHERPLYVALGRSKPTIPIERVQLPQLTRHPWLEMSKALRTAPRDEPLAKAAPAEFYFARVKSFDKFLALLDWLSEWGQPAADLLDSRSEDRGSVARYQDELGLERSGLSRVLGPSVIEDVAVVGSDPYVHEGTDITLLFRVKSLPAFETGLSAALSARSQGHGELTRSSFEHAGVKVSVARSADGRVRQHRASANGIELVSNSPNAIRRVLSTILGQHPNLASEPDFQYMLGRERDVENDALAYIGDSFVAAVTGPAQKIGEARRLIAFAELCAPGYAALLSGWVDGKSAASQKALLDAKWLNKTDLVHGNGVAIAFEPGKAATSSAGSPAALEPLIDQPAVTKVTPEEQQAYSWFANSYSALWSDRIDPIALSSRLGGSGDERTLSGDLRVLPLLRREYREWIEIVGNARVSARSVENGARVLVGIGKDARLRGFLDEFGHDFLGSDKLKFDWLGDYALVGVSNRNEIANAVLDQVRDELERPDPQQPNRMERLRPQVLVGLPVYAVVALKSPLAAGLALTALRQRAAEAAPGAMEWGEAASYRGQAVVKVLGREMGETMSIYYSLLPSAFAISLSEAALHEAIDQTLDQPPTATQPGAGQASRNGQVVFELGGEKQSALYRVLAWLAQMELLRYEGNSALIAEAVLRGAPETQTSPERFEAVARNYFGALPLTPDGRRYEESAEGPRDPVRGTRFAPTYPDVPVPGSTLDRVLSAVRHMKSEQSYDDEPGSTPAEPRQSLHVRLDLRLRTAAR